MFSSHARNFPRKKKIEAKMAIPLSSAGLLSVIMGLVAYALCAGTLYHSFVFLYQHQLPEGLDILKEIIILLEGNVSRERMIGNLLLLLIFLLQHAGMASKSCKNFWKSGTIAHLERSFYVFLTSLSLEVMISLKFPSKFLLSF